MQQVEPSDDFQLTYTHILGFLFSFLFSLLIGVGCCGFSWMLTYYNSLEPGAMPPTPVSPVKYRELSGHTFHINYSMCILNGICAFAIALWLLSTSTTSEPK